MVDVNLADNAPPLEDPIPTKIDPQQLIDSSLAFWGRYFGNWAADRESQNRRIAKKREILSRLKRTRGGKITKGSLFRDAFMGPIGWAHLIAESQREKKEKKLDEEIRKLSNGHRRGIAVGGMLCNMTLDKAKRLAEERKRREERERKLESFWNSRKLPPIGGIPSEFKEKISSRLFPSYHPRPRPFTHIIGKY